MHAARRPPVLVVAEALNEILAAKHAIVGARLVVGVRAWIVVQRCTNVDQGERVEFDEHEFVVLVQVEEFRQEFEVGDEPRGMEICWEIDHVRRGSETGRVRIGWNLCRQRC